ncbi:MAG: amino acid adenylation domain-containing protein [Rhodobacteraceae bacterium]|nr:amino acid adenylation domain-containing protein [Paracoccaceae bacterium]
MWCWKRPRRAPASADDGPHILPLSARTPEALEVMRAQMADFLERESPDLGDLSHTLQLGRHAHSCRSAIACTDRADAVMALRKPGAPRLAPEDTPPLVFMFPGQGSQYPGMGSGLYATEPVFRDWIDRGAALLEPLLDLNINDLLCFAQTSDAAAARALRETRLTQPALYLVQVATAQLWLSRGITPTAMIGHSVGEFAAATLAGVMSFETGLKIIAARGRLMQDQPGGAMLSVRADHAALDAVLDDSVDLAARNAPRLHVLAGSHEAIAAMQVRLEQVGIPASLLHTSHAFHSRMMDPVTDPLRREMQGLPLHEPQIPYVSCVSGTWITKDEARDPAYWAAQARATVNFEAGIQTVSEGQGTVMLEVGAGSTLSAFARQTLKQRGHGGIFSSLPDHTRPVPDAVAMAHSAAQLWTSGFPLDWSRWRKGSGRRIAAPSYPFERRPYWIEAPAPLRRAGLRAAEPGTLQPITQGILPMPNDMTAPATLPAADRKPRLVAELCALLCDLSGEELGPQEAPLSFLELGFDSLFLGQVSQSLGKTYGVQITFRQLLSDIPSVDALAAHLDGLLPSDEAPVAQAVPATTPVASVPDVAMATPAVAAQAAQIPVSAMPQVGAGMEGVVQSQLAVMQTLFSEQLRALAGGQSQPVSAPVLTPAAVDAPITAPVTAPPAPAVNTTTPEDEPVRYAIGRGMAVSGAALDDRQRAFARDLAERYARKHAGSKARTDRYRTALADPRTAAGFRAEWKEMVFPIIAEHAKGARIRDIDGNEFIDIVSGFGQTAFGHAPDFVLDALRNQMERGFAIGPQSDLAGSTAEHFARFTRHERVSFCNTGSEAVMAAMRVARTVTGRDRIVVFANDYHGQFDEVLVKGRSRGATPSALPIAPGIPRSALNNMVVLPYGGAEALDWIRAHLDEIAAFVVEPVQSRHPEHRPAEFVRALRDLADQSGAALVFDEVVTGFRVHKRGMQGLWGIRADLATYGKIVGGGMPIGVLAGDGRFMNALDGGPWRYGDASKPETPPTFFAGTFVRHPLALAAVAATLEHMELRGDQLWTGVADRTRALLDRFDQIFDSRGLPRLISGFSSWYAFNLVQHNPTAALAYPMLRMAGVHVQEGYCGFMTTAHSDADFAHIGATMESVVDQLQEIGVLDGTRAEPASAPPAPQDTAIPLSPAQREIWMIAQLGDLASTSFNEGMVIELAGDLDIPALGRSLTAVVARHDALRLLFARNGDSFEVADPYDVALPCHDLRSEADPDAALAALLDTEARTPFDLVDGPPFRAALVQRGDGVFTLVLNAHHIVCDGWSYNVLIADLARLYSAEVTGQPADLPAAPSFAAHALQHARTPMDPAVEGYWRAQYHSLPELPELPTDRARPNRRSFRGATCSRMISAAQMKRFRKAGARQGCTLFSTLFAGLHMLLARLSGAQDFAIGVPTGGQALLENPALIGHCVHFLPIRAQLDPDTPAGVHLRQIRDQVLGAFDHQATTYGALVEALAIERSLSRLPLTEVQFNLEKVADGAQFEGLRMSIAPNAKAGVNFDLFFNMIESDEGLRVDVDYNSDLFDGDTINRWIGHLETLLGAVADDADTPLKALPLLNAAEAEALEARCNATAAPLPDLSLADLLREGAQRQPGALAFEAEDGRLTHAEFDALSDAMAAQIQNALPEPGARIAVALERSLTMVAALVAVLKAGHAYVPLDPRQPDQRLGLILQGAQASAIITADGALPAYAQGMDLLALGPVVEDIQARPQRHPVNPEAAAYVIFTSGSTGTPKGVEIPQRAVINFLSSMAQAPGFTEQDRILAVTTVSFDIAVLELLLPLATGGSAVIARSDDVLDPFRLVDRIGQGDITVLQATPTLWQMLLEAGFTPAAQVKMLAGGEPLPADLAARLVAGGGELWNMYGPTETTVWSAAHRITPEDDRITIGYPIANTQLPVLDAEDALVPPGMIGELNIGGAGLALGYFQRPDLTEAAFRMVALPSGPQMLYKTGDMARRLADGRIEVLGRRDNQIKLRGFRIELGDVETAMRGLAGVQKAAAAVQRGHDGAMQLVGYVVPEPGATLAAPDMMQALQARLPAYMVPTAWVTLDVLPQTMNGKLDRKALPAPVVSSMAAPAQGTTAPATDLERQIAAIWQEVLGLDSISTTDTLFALGADSLKVFRIAARLLDADLNLDARDLLEHPTIRDLATFAASGERDRGGARARPSLRDFRNGARRAGMRADMTAAQ